MGIRTTNGSGGGRAGGGDGRGGPTHGTPGPGDAGVEVDPALDPVELPSALLHEIEQHAREAIPEECCGLVTGHGHARFLHSHRCANEMTRLHQAAPARYPLDGRSAFHMSPLDYDRVEREAALRGERVTAVYHSHVGARAWFSRRDLAFALAADFPFPDADHIVVAVDRDERRVLERALFRRAPGPGPLRGHALRRAQA